jgi:hypothetical protein
MKSLSSLLALALASGVVLFAVDASATKLRRPFAEEKSFNYGFDYNGSAAGCKDYNCGDRCYDGHGGNDYALVLGTNVMAPADGTVVATHDGCANYGGLGSTCGGGCGNYVKMQLPDGNFVLFCHLQLGSLQVNNGASVKCGQIVGRSASSGNSSGPHLHLGWRNPSNVNMNPYKGTCSSSPGAWVDQGTYWGATGAQCECVAGTEVCNGKDDDCDGLIDEDDVCEREALLLGQSWVAPARTSDVDGDGRSDVCGRGGAGVWCHLSQGTAWAVKGPTLPLSDANGWTDPTNWGTLRMGDLDGDGRADICGRGNDGVACWKSDGTSFSVKMDGPGWADDNGWGGFQYHSTIRLLDVDGDGKDDLCARAAKGIICLKSTGDAFGSSFDGPAWSDAAGMASAKYYGTLRTGDVDGDGREDLCMRTQDGVECWLSDGKGFPTKVQGPAWSDASGWGAMQYWSTIRLADVNGDGRADLCARAAAGLRCHFSQGDTFADAVEVAALSDATGWADPSNYLTLRVGDVDGDRAQDLCIRANARMLCYRRAGTAFESFDGPAWSDADGWDKPEYFHTIQLGDMNGDGLADLCGRHVAGWRCHPSTGLGFGDAIALDEFTDAGGWSAPQYYATMQLGGPLCISSEEICNGVDDDCDGEVDEGVCLPDGGAGAAGGWSGSGGSGGSGGSEASGGAGGAGGTGQGGSSAAGSSGSASVWDGGSDDAGCACRAAGTSQGFPAFLLVSALGAVAWRRRRNGFYY